MQAPRAFGLLVVMGFGFATTGVVHAAPVTVDYPSTTCPVAGDHGLQDCIDSVDPGSTVVLTTEIINEGAAIAKSLTLRAVDRSLQPVLLGVLVNSPATGAANVTIQDIRFSILLNVNLTTGSGHSITIQRVDVGSGSPARGMAVQAYVPSAITIENSIIRSDQEAQSDVIELFTQDPAGLVKFRLVGNRITAHGDTQSSSGIDLSMEGTGSARADILNNVIWDVATCHCGAASGIDIDPDPTFNATVNIVGNTIDNSATNAIQQRNSLTTGRLVLNVYNNIFTHNLSSPLNLESGNAGTLLFHAGFNDFFGNAQPNNLDGQSAGPNNLLVDPRYLDRSVKNFRLASNSPLVNKGSTCSLGGIANPDAGGRHRLAGPSVDIGAYELGGPVINGVVKLGTQNGETINGTDGADILCGYGGNDLIGGARGPDYIDGGAGGDRLFGGFGVDRVLGNLGNDTICNHDGAGGDIADGGPDSDKADTDPGDTRVAVEGSVHC